MTATGKSKFVQVSMALAILAAGCFSCQTRQETGGNNEEKLPATFTLTRDQLGDKIMGGWAGQVIGCTFGGPTEFDYQGTMIQDYQPIAWNEEQMEWYYLNAPGLYDDVYMDLTFVEVIDKEGVDAPASSHARAFAHAGYSLWHANQAARYNILRGMEPPATGYWENNPHADDIDFQIEADFAGLMNPGMVNSASDMCDRVGHIMNYGDGWYGGVYVAAMYALAFYSDDVEFVVREALKSIPEESQFYQCIRDVIGWYAEFPEDWKQNWFEVQRKWSSDIGCPDGVFDPFDIDAKINAAYIVIGLLYGDGDFGRTLEISTRCGQDSDCNPASAGGILGTMIGYAAIPPDWKAGLDRVEDMEFKYTTISLNKVYEMSQRHALEMIRRNGGEAGPSNLTIPLQEPVPVRFERGFEGHYPVHSFTVPWPERSLIYGGSSEYVFSFEGKGFVVQGGARKTDNQLNDKELIVDVYVDGELAEKAELPTGFQSRRHEVTWKYNLPEEIHEVRLVWAEPADGYRIDLNRVIAYGPAPEE
ncbi:MAG: ADP-ribosylglycohydrolase family protein [Bacteroidales bacterium]